MGTLRIGTAFDIPSRKEHFYPARLSITYRLSSRRGSPTGYSSYVFTTEPRRRMRLGCVWAGLAVCIASAGAEGLAVQDLAVDSSSASQDAAAAATVVASDSTDFQDCVLSLWSSWSACSHSCGASAQRSRSRTVELEAEGAAGQPCGALSATEACPLVPCPVDCVLSAWSSWTACSRTCGGGQQQRARAITTAAAHGGTACAGEMWRSEYRACGAAPCPVDCLVGGWDCHGCDRTCDIGVRQCARPITVGAAHGGKSCPAIHKIEACNAQMCPMDCQLSAWGSWSECSATCGMHAKRARTRAVRMQAAAGGAACGARQQTTECADGPLPACALDCLETLDESFGACSATCGGGTQSRHVQILQPAAATGKPCVLKPVTRTCGMVPCPIDCAIGAWGGWSGCDAQCAKHRERKITRSAAHGGVACAAVNLTMAAPCTPLQCAETVDCALSDWGAWSACSESCTSSSVPSGFRTRARWVISRPSHDGAPCGALSETHRDSCANVRCPVDCVASAWTPWSQCSSSCGGGVTSRARYPLVEAAYGGKECGELSSARACNDHVCANPLCHKQHAKCQVVGSGDNSRVAVVHSRLNVLGGTFHCAKTHLGDEDRMFAGCTCTCDAHLPCCSHRHTVLANEALPGNRYTNVATKEECCHKCVFHPLCTSWEWNAHGDSTCELKQGVPQFKAQQNVTSSQFRVAFAGARAGDSCGAGSTTTIHGVRNWDTGAFDSVTYSYSDQPLAADAAD